MSSSDEIFSIGYWTQEPGQPAVEMHLREDITEEEFNAYVAVIATYRAITERHMYELLHRHYDRLSSMVAAYANVERLGGNFRNVNTRVMNVTFMGEVTSWLAAGRLYLESTRDFILRQFGEASDQLRRFELATNRAFDGFAGYRFMYNLRDYTQHCGPPLGGSTLSRDDQARRKLDYYLSRSELLLAHFNWSRHAKELFSGWPEHILVMPLVDEAIDGYRIIEDELLVILLEDCNAAAPRIREGIERVAPEPGQHPAVFRDADRGDSLRFAFQSFPDPRMSNSLKSPPRARTHLQHFETLRKNRSATIGIRRRGTLTRRQRPLSAPGLRIRAAVPK